MKLSGASTSRFLPALLLAACSLLVLLNWPRLHDVVSDPSLQHPLLALLFQLLMLIPLAGGFLLSLAWGRMLIWPWLWLAGIWLLPLHPPLQTFELLLCLATEICLLLGIAVAESLFTAWHARLHLQFPTALAALPLLLAGWQLELVPDNPGWQRLILLAALALLLASQLPARLASLLPRRRSLQPALKLPRISMRLPELHRTQPAPTEQPPAPRPMLSLDQGYLVRHRDRRQRMG